MKNTALTLFEHAGLVTGDEKAEVIFTTEITTSVLPKGATEIVKTTSTEELEKLVAAGGTIVGRKSVVKQTKQGDARTLLSLKGKVNQPKWEMTKREAEMFGAKVIRARLANMDWDRVGLKRFAETLGKDGLTVLDIKLKELPLKEASITLEQALAAWPHMKREEVIHMFALAGIRPKGINVDIKTEVVPPPQLSEGVQDLINEAVNTEKQEQAAAQAQAQADAPKKGSKK